PRAPFACNVCKRCYFRVDHLARHYRSHTQERPFPCEVCGKEFSRADMLKRHATGHSDGTNKRKRKSSPSKRAFVACIGCSLVKLKCGNEKPCCRCLKKGMDCIPTIPSSRSPHDKVSSRLNISIPSEYSEQASDSVGGTLQLGFFAEEGNTVELAFPDTLSLDNVSLEDFLANITMPITPSDVASSAVAADLSNARLRDIFNFGNDADIGSADLDFGLLDSYTTSAVYTYNQITADSTLNPPSRAEGESRPEVSSFTVEAFQRSLWRWQPGVSDKAHDEQMSLSLPHDINASSTRRVRPFGEALAQSARDKILAMLFNNCEQDAFSHIISQFPSVEALNSLMQEFLSIHDSTTDSFLHVSTFQPQHMRSELLTMAVSYGAVCSTIPVVRRLGFALQEVVRLSLPKAFEKNNSMTRNLQLHQANILQLQVGLWSGHKRKMEIAESHGLPFMLRRSDRFKWLRKPPTAPTVDDSQDALDEKWQAWAVAESWKRLAYFITKYDSQVSMSFHVPPLIAYGEISLDLPETSKLWKAGSTCAWRDEYLNISSATKKKKKPAPAACRQDAQKMLEAQDSIDLIFAVDIALSFFWRLIWDARQLQAATKQYSGPSNMVSLMSGHWQHEVHQTLDNFCMVVAEAPEISAATQIVHEHLLLNLYVSFEELSLFAGKEGHQEARRILPSLMHWAESRNARQALWHAGQVLREATAFTPIALQDFYAISLYHAGLTLWAYGILTQRLHRTKKPCGRDYDRRGITSDELDIVFLDKAETGEKQKFIALNRGNPAITKRDNSASVDRSSLEAVSLNDPKRVMETVVGVLQFNHRAHTVPPLVENLTRLMDDLS
ncbi:hypothetical protein EK21DRAFT_43882, partial [Setomelanomma holmii]